MFGLDISRILHVLGVVIWIGGLAMVTLVILPAVKKFKSPEERISFFELIESKFSNIAKISSLVTGLSGFYMISKLKAWSWFLDASYWWMHLMVIVWVIFTIMIFVLEPLVLEKRMKEKAKIDPEGTYNKIQKMHSHLLWLSILAIIGAVAGSHGWLFF